MNPTGFNNRAQMGTYKQVFYHIVFGTKHRRQTINEENETELYKYIWGILNNKNVNYTELMVCLTIFIFYVTYIQI
nr:transposase [Chryseobacterium sp. JAH]